VSGIVQVYNPGCITPSMAMLPFRLCTIGYTGRRITHKGKGIGDRKRREREERRKRRGRYGSGEEEGMEVKYK
jgi:hypothetical protein